MKKRALPLLLALVMVISLLPVTVQAGELDSDLLYEVYEDYDGYECVEITEYHGAAAELVIPAEIEGLPVTSIGPNAFENCPNLTTISIPYSVTYIASQDFINCENLTKIHVDINNPSYSSDMRGVLFDKEKTILIKAPKAIADSYTVPEGVISIEDSAFYNCRNLTNIELPDSIISIGYHALAFCHKLTCISIPDSVTTIGDYAFIYCAKLTGIHVDENNPNYSSDDRGVLFNKEKTLLIQAPCEIADSYVIPYGVTTISTDSFGSCNKLTSVSIPDSVATIGDTVFYNCSSLANINIPDSVTTIGSGVFFSCSSLTEIDIPGSIACIGSQFLANCSSLTTIRFKGNAPAIVEYSFYGVKATAYYPAGDPTWTPDVMQDYGGTITWIPYNPNNPFTDVPAGSFYEEPVLWALENGITTGATADTFNPGDSCLRAQVVTFLHRASGNPEPTNTNNPFEDVKSSDFFYKPVLWAVEKSITNGSSTTTFGSYDVCNRAAVVTFLWRAAGSPEPESSNNPFEDVKSSDFFYKSVLWAIESGITNGVDATHFGPTSPCNRAQVVTFLYRAYN